MKPSKSLTSVASQQHQMNGSSNYHRKQPQPPPDASVDHYPQPPRRQQSASAAPTSPICRCRVMYLGSSVPHITKDGLQGIQEPLRELYPDKASLGSGNAGIDSWLSVWSNGILIENVDETGREVKRFFKIEALHYCAAVKYVPQVFATQTMNGNATLPHNLAALPKFLPLDSPHARMQQDSSSNPPIFASILRRTTGVKVLECHAFICKREAAANALVRCCFHAYADTMYAKQIGAEVGEPVKHQSSASLRRTDEHLNQNGERQSAGMMTPSRRSKSIAALNDVNGRANDSDSQQGHDYPDAPYITAMPRRKSLSTSQQVNYTGENEMNDHAQRQLNFDSNNLQNQMKRFSKSMHQLNQSHLDQAYDGFVQDQLNASHQPPTNEPIFPHNPYASRIPSYPPQSIIDQQQQQQQQSHNGGTLRSVRSVAANSIASTLLRSKKHAKAMSMAQLNQSNMLMPSQPMSFHQFQLNQQANNPFMTLPPVPAMFMPRGDMSGSQTMKLPSRHLLQATQMPMNFEAMTPKEMKKLLKKSAKYGLTPGGGKFGENGLPMLPLRPMPMPVPVHMQAGMFGALPPPPPPPPPLGSESGTFNSHTMFANEHHQNGGAPGAHLDMADFGGGPGPAASLPRGYCLGPRGTLISQEQANAMMDPSQQQPIKSILVKPNPEFLKSKAGKKWLKQQKEFKKLLPAHLDGLPIVFGPPPLDALETAGGPNSGAGQQAPFIAANGHLMPPPPPLPLLDSNGFYNPHPLYGPSGRASAASTMLRNSPQVMQQQHLTDEQSEYLQRNHHHHHNHHHQQSMYSNPMSMMGQNNSMQAPLPPPPPPMLPPHQQLAGEELYQRQRSQQHLGVAYDGQSMHRRRRRSNHMVEQSVISLGDEEDGEPSEGPDEQEAEEEYERALAKHNQRPQKNGYYNRVEGDQRELPTNRQEQQARARKANGYEQPDSYQDDYEQIAQHQAPPSEDRNSNSSGIYRRRGHINERAFSYSIRQEASKSSADNSDAEYRNGDMSDASHYQHSNHNNHNNNHIEYRLGNQSSQLTASHYDNPQQGNIYQNKSSMQYYKKQSQPPLNHHLQNQQPVDDLSSRLENQLNMKSFANSCVKSNM